MYSYLLNCILIWIQFQWIDNQNENEWRGGCLRRFGKYNGTILQNIAQPFKDVHYLESGLGVSQGINVAHGKGT